MQHFHQPFTVQHEVKRKQYKGNVGQSHVDQSPIMSCLTEESHHPCFAVSMRKPKG